MPEPTSTVGCPECGAPPGVHCNHLTGRRTPAVPIATAPAPSIIAVGAHGLLKRLEVRGG